MSSGVHLRPLVIGFLVNNRDQSSRPQNGVNRADPLHGLGHHHNHALNFPRYRTTLLTDNKIKTRILKKHKSLMSGVPPVQSRLNHSSAMDLDPWATSPIQARTQSDWPDCSNTAAFYPGSYEWSRILCMHACTLAFYSTENRCL